MISRRAILIGGSVAAVAGFTTWNCFRTGVVPDAMPAPVALPPATFRLGLIPERNLYEQRQAYQMLAEYLGARVHVSRGKSTVDGERPFGVELVTSSNYAGVLRDFAEGDVDGAFLGSLAAVLAVDRSGAEVLLKSENVQGRDTYAGVVFVREDSPVRALAELSGRKLGAVRTTMAGSLYPLLAFKQAGLMGAAMPEFVWTGTHDDVIEEVVAGRVDAGAVKDLRLDAYEAGHGGIKFRRLATGPRAPDNAFVIRGSLAPDVREALTAALLNMEKEAGAALVLAKLNLKGFAPCGMAEYGAVYDMIEALGPGWNLTGVEGPAPKRRGGL